MTLRKRFGSPNKIIIGKDAFERLKDLAVKAYPNEACGIMLGDGDNGPVREIWPVKNTEEDEPGWLFRTEPLELYRLELRAEKENKTITGFYHSHPDAPAVISSEDEKYLVPGMIWLIVSVYHGVAEKTAGYLKEAADGELAKIEIETEDNVK